MRFAFLTILFGALSMACPAPTTCFDGLAAHKRYRVHIVNEYKPGAPLYFADFDNIQETYCGAIDGIKPGASFSFWLARRRETDQCEQYDGFVRPDSQDVPGIKVTLKPAIATNAVNSRNILIGYEQGGLFAETSAGCTGSWAFNIKYRSGGDIFAPVAATDATGFVLERSFIPSGEPSGICQRCSDTFGAYLEKL